MIHSSVSQHAAIRSALPGRLAPAFVLFPRWQKARDRACAALLAGETRLLLTGPAGTGKTLLLDHAAHVLRAAGWQVQVWQADGRPPPAAAAAPSALFVDEADRLSRRELETLLRTTPGPLLLAGLEPLASRAPAGSRVCLAPLTPDESRDFIAQWLALAGRSPAHVTPSAVERLLVLAGGVPRLLSTLLAAACWLAETAGRPTVELQHVRDAGSLRPCFDANTEAEPTDSELPDEEQARPASPRRRVHAMAPAMAALLLLTATGFTAGRVWPTETRLASDLIVQQATRLTALGTRLTQRLPGSTELADAAPAHAAAPIAAAPAGMPPLLAAEAPPPPRAADSEAAVPELAASAPVVLASIDIPPTAAAPAPLAAAAPSPISAGMLETMLQRGQAMLDLGDLSAARLLFARAAELGSSEAMLSMGGTFDPTVLDGRLLANPDEVEATRWYRMAAASGNPEAALRLQRLMRQAAR